MTARHPRAFRLLLDSNVLFSAEPFAGELEQRFAEVARLYRLASQHGHRLVVHPASLEDASTDSDLARRRQRLAELGKYELLSEVPVPADLRAIFGHPAPGSRDERDLRILAAVPARAATHLVTADEKLRRRAARAGFGAAVLAVADAIELLEALTRPASQPPPRVREIQPYQVDPSQAIFTSIRQDYEDFDDWLDRVRSDQDNRRVFIIEAGGRYEAIAILKLQELTGDYGLPSEATKIATFKVDPTAGGQKLGELLLKAVLLDAVARDCPVLFVEVFDHHFQLIAMLEDFGFRRAAERTSDGQTVLVKLRWPPEDSEGELDPLDYHVTYGPPALRVEKARIVPIEPRWFDQLFPDSPLAAPPERTLPLFDDEDTRPWGNALRKAYVSWRVHHIRRGDLLLFYRSRDTQGVAAIGVVEDTCVSDDPDELVTFLGQRTVYRPEDIEDFCRRGGKVTAVMFRQDRFIDPPWPREMLRDQGLIRSWPQTIAQVREEGLSWLRAQVESP